MISTTAEKHRVSDLARAQARTGYLFVLPTFVLYLTFVLAPVAVTIVLSFHVLRPDRRLALGGPG